MSYSDYPIPLVDLVIVIDTSPSMKDEAQALSAAAESAINAARSSCPSDLKVAWFGIEGTWSNTHFDRTLRDYLTSECGILESELRGRKRGKVKNAGAQEDGARTIEDIATRFNWREGAARAIFYLGDEALEGGGSRTETEDIEAANLAIQKAQAGGVTVHTYFGTSKSSHREGLISEYDRLATETGGRAFTDRDAIDGFTTVLEQVICGSHKLKISNVQSQRGTVYIQDCVANELSKLYTLDVATGSTTLIGEIATEVSDIAFIGSQLYGLDRIENDTQFVKIDPITGDTSVVGNIGFAVAGLAYNRHNKALYATTAKQLIAINSETGKGTVAATLSDRDRNCGEIAFSADGTAYITLIGYNRKKFLAACNVETGAVKLIGDTGFPDLASMEFFGDILYGITGNFFDLGKDGQLIRLDPATGQGTFLAMTDPIARWAGMSLGLPIGSESSPETPENLMENIDTNSASTTESSPKENIDTNSASTTESSPEENTDTDSADTSKGRQDVTIPASPVYLSNLSFDSFDRDPALDIICVAPIRTIVRREEEITIIRKVRKVEEIDVSPTCPVNSVPMSEVESTRN